MRLLSDIDDFIFIKSFEINNPTDIRFDNIDVFYVSYASNLLPWSPRAQKCAQLIRQCFNQKKLIFCERGAFLSMVYICATNIQKFSVQVLNNRTGQFDVNQKLINDGIEIKDQYSGNEALFDFCTGDLYFYSISSNSWTSRINTGIHKKIATENNHKVRNLIFQENQKLKKFKIGDKNPLFEKTEKVIQINPHFLNHWLYKGVKESFVVQEKSNFEMHKFCLKAPELAFSIFGSTNRAPVFIVLNTDKAIGIQFRVNKKYKETVTIFRNFVERSLQNHFFPSTTPPSQFQIDLDKIIMKKKKLISLPPTVNFSSVNLDSEELDEEEIQVSKNESSRTTLKTLQKLKQRLNTKSVNHRGKVKFSGYTPATKYTGYRYVDSNSIGHKSFVVNNREVRKEREKVEEKKLQKIYGKTPKSSMFNTYDFNSNTSIKNSSISSETSEDLYKNKNYFFNKKSKNQIQKALYSQLKIVPKKADVNNKYLWVPGFYKETKKKRAEMRKNAAKIIKSMNDGHLYQKEVQVYSNQESQSGSSCTSSRNRSSNDIRRQDIKRDPRDGEPLISQPYKHIFFCRNEVSKLKAKPRFFTKFKKVKKVDVKKERLKKLEKMKLYSDQIDRRNLKTVT